MILGYSLFLIPLALYVLAFLYETLLSFLRLWHPEAGRTGYVHATWEITNTLLIFALIVMLMMFTKSIDEIASVMFMPSFLAAVALALRAVFYIYIFYVRSSPKRTLADWIFAFSHLFAAIFLIVGSVKALLYLFKNNPDANEQFIPLFIPGLILIGTVCLVPILFLYSSKSSKS